MFQKKNSRKNQQHFIFSNCFLKIRGFYKIMWKDIVQPHKRWQYGTCAIYDGYLRLETHTQNMQQFLLFYCKNRYSKAPPCYVIRILSVFHFICRPMHLIV